MEDTISDLDEVLHYARVSAETLARLEKIWPHSGWESTGNHVVYRNTLWLQVSSESERRVYWVLVEDSDDVVRVWDLGEIPDLV